MLSSLFSLFDVIGEFHWFLHRGRAKIRLLFAVFCYFLFSKRQFVLRELVRRLNLQRNHILTHILAFVSAP